MGKRKRQQCLLEFANERSRFWIPSLLDSMASLAAAVCEADGCSIFLKRRPSWKPEEALYLAATTRRELRPHLFDEETAYVTEKRLLYLAGAHYRKCVNKVRARPGYGAMSADKARIEIDREFQESEASGYAGLTGWVAAFSRSLNIGDLTSFDHGRYSDGDEIPIPVWSDRTRGFYDWRPPRPFLAVPILTPDKERVLGVIRVSTIRDDARRFTKAHEEELKRFAEVIGKLIVDRGLDEPKQPTAPDGKTDLFPHLCDYFRIWAEVEGGEMVNRVTEAVPRIFDVDCCSFFARDKNDDFVLTSTSASVSLLSNANAKEHYLQFAGLMNNLYYPTLREGPTSKTGFCIRTQQPVLLRRKRGGKNQKRHWQLIGDATAKSEVFNEEVSGCLKDERKGDSANACEMDYTTSEVILLVPVRDVINPRKLAGVLRVVATRKEVDHGVLNQIYQFGMELAHRLGERNRVSKERAACEQLTLQLGELEPGKHRMQKAAEIVARALEADTVTIFIWEPCSPGEGADDEAGPQGTLRSKLGYSFFNEDQVTKEQEASTAARHREEFREFERTLSTVTYDGKGRTMYPALNRKILRLKSLHDRAELAKRNIDPAVKHCEFRDVGPFLAAPIEFSSAQQDVDGVIRALRWRQSLQGPFSMSHELILKACTPLLAQLLREERPTTVVISYCFARTDVSEPIKEYLTALGVRVETCEFDPDTDNRHLFKKKLQEAAGAILIATPDQAARSVGGKGPSSNVLVELGTIHATVKPERTIVVRQTDSELPAMGEAMPGFEPVEVEFDVRTGLQSVFVDLARVLNEWDLIGRVRPAAKKMSVTAEKETRQVELKPTPPKTDSKKIGKTKASRKEAMTSRSKGRSTGRG